ncbi:histidine phosphatase family protein [Planctomicrobium sp. SH661]|uniref:histidine phosphatase family protein n=1 Tax=Planctomicrobium sp. SH661 TaxID=3448124 RepID=UPI003F5C7FE0
MSQFVVRPGETDFDVQDRIQGALDLPMNACGIAQVEKLVSPLRDADLDLIYTSPSEPSLSAARKLGQELDLPVKVLDGLANSNLGLWQGLSRSEIRQKQSRVFRQWEDAPESVCPPCGELPEELTERVERALKKPVRRGGSFAIVVSEPVASLVVRLLSGATQAPAGAETRPGTCCRVELLDAVAH